MSLGGRVKPGPDDHFLTDRSKMMSDEDWERFKQQDIAQSRKTLARFVVLLALNGGVSAYVATAWSWLLGILVFISLFAVILLAMRRALLRIMMIEGPWPPKPPERRE
jgi:hypothetical protein